jgi:hypothetical protein
MSARRVIAAAGRVTPPGELRPCSWLQRFYARWVKKLVEYCNTPWNMDGVPITLGEFVEYRDPQPQTRTGIA